MNADDDDVVAQCSPLVTLASGANGAGRSRHLQY